MCECLEGILHGPLKKLTGIGEAHRHVLEVEEAMVTAKDLSFAGHLGVAEIGRSPR